MGIIFRPYRAGQCCLCGATASLTGEHKIKASSLREIFGRDAMIIGSFGGKGPPRAAQGPKSKAFHFSARICASCNSSRTQAGDQEFDKFHLQIAARIQNGEDPQLVFTLPRYEIGSESYLNVFRYFSKLLCCHIAESEGPCAIALSKFAIGEMDRNPVFLSIDSDPIYARCFAISPDIQFASHGGLIVPFNPKTGLPTGFHSSLTLGPVRYRFWVRFGPWVGFALRAFHRDFWSRCHAAFREALENPLLDEE